MKSNKVRFIHLRDTQPGTDVANPLGGATIAWRFDEADYLLVGAPAVCSPKDHFNKAEGRRIAEQNLEMAIKPLAFVIPRDDMIAELLAGCNMFDGFRDLTPRARQTLKDAAVGLIEDSMHDFVNITWFEGLVRDRVAFHEGRVHTSNKKVYGPAAK